MSTPLQKAALFVTGTAGLGYGTYYLSQSKDVSKFDKDVKDIERLIETEQKRIATNKRLTQEFEGKVVDLGKQGQEKQKAVVDAEIKLDAARKQVTQLEGLLKAKKDDAAKATADLKTAHSKLGELKADIERAAESVTLGQKSLALARENLKSSQLLLNPLNHPKVKSLLGK